LFIRVGRLAAHTFEMSVSSKGSNARISDFFWEVEREERRAECKRVRLLGRTNINDALADGEIAAMQRVKLSRDNFKPPCDCAECRDGDGRRHLMPKLHSCDYTAARSALVPKAVEIATDKMGDLLGNNGNRWTRCFVEAMNELAAPLLKQSGNGAKPFKRIGMATLRGAQSRRARTESRLKLRIERRTAQG
jgi:hypothetical protein